MGFNKVILTLSLMALTVAPFSLAQGDAKVYLAAHNVVRAEVGVEPLVWNNTLAAYAQNYSNSKINNFVFEHSNYLEYGYGECLAASSDLNFSGPEAVKLWADEKQYYDYASNTCQKGQVCGHYTQLVWRDTRQVGCARVKCNNGYIFISCNYFPIGNYVGERPY